MHAGSITTELMLLASKLTDTVSSARLLAAQSALSGDWLHAPPLTAIVLRLSDKAIRVAVGMRLGINLYHINVHVVLWSTPEAYMGIWS